MMILIILTVWIAVGLLGMVADSIDRENDRIASGWTGNASGEYRKKISRERDLVRRRAQQLSQSAQGVRRAAKRMYDTEMFALSLFSRR